MTVPVTQAILKMKSDGTAGVDFEKFVAEAIRVSRDPKVEWRVEETKVEPHPLQQAAPEGRKSFDAFHDVGNTQKKR